MFRGKESSNRIELSRLVQDLLNFGVSGSLWLWGWEGWVDGGGWGWVDGGGWGVAPTHVHTHAHAHVVNMIISCKWPPPLGEYLGILYDVMRVHVRVCACVCTWVGCTLSPPILTTHPSPHPLGGTHGISQNSIALELIEIFQFCLKI